MTSYTIWRVLAGFLAPNSYVNEDVTFVRTLLKAMRIAVPSR